MLGIKTQLKKYRKLCSSEILFMQNKNYIPLSTYKFIGRLLFLSFLTYIYCSVQENTDDSFSKGLLICRNEVKKRV